MSSSKEETDATAPTGPSDKPEAPLPQQQEPPSPFSSLLPHSKDDALLEAFRYINSVPGKDVRGKLIDCFQLWFRVPSDGVLVSVKDIVGELHNASLLIDDIEDNSQLRRGIPVAHNIFGIPTTINTANYIYFLALEKVHALSRFDQTSETTTTTTTSTSCSGDAMKVFVGELLNLHRGQGHDIAWRDSMRCPTEEEYLVMVKDKTGGLFRLAVGLLQSFATENRNTDFSNLVNNLAMYFQIRDDYINLADEEYFKSKSFCEDLTEGKFSFPIIHCIRSNPADTRLLSILKQRTDSVDVKRYAQTVLKEAESLEYTREKCSELKQQIVQEVESFGGNPPLLKIIQVLDVQLEQMSFTCSSPSTKNKRMSVKIDEA